MEITENIFTACKAIIETLVNEDDKNIREIKRQDFIHKYNKLNKSDENVKQKKDHFDVIIFTVVPIEFNTFRKLLMKGRKLRSYKYDFNGIQYYEIEINRSDEKKALKTLVTFLGIAGDVNCSIACSRVFQELSCDLAILCGIAAGIKGKIPMYSTAIATHIVNYEFQRIEEDSITYRPKFFKTNPYNEKIIERINIYSDEWKDFFLEFTKDLLEAHRNDKNFPHKEFEQLQLQGGPVSSGAKLIADGKTLQNLRRQIPVEKGIIAAEMEGSGFSPACDEYNMNWLVFRGISDYGGKEKNTHANKKYQYIAAASAISAMIYYLDNFYRTPEERGDTNLIF